MTRKPSTGSESGGRERLDTPSPKVFVVDDDPSVRRGLERLIRAGGYQVESFESAEAYLESPTDVGVACVLVDLRMTGMDGLELQNRLRYRRGSLPVVFLTGHGDIPSSVRAMKAGAVDFLTKPVDEKDLFRAINAALTIARASQGARARVGRLTPREYEVMRGVIAGMMNKEIALALGIAEKTVKVHRGKVMLKAGTSSVPELVRLCAEIGVVPR